MPRKIYDFEEAKPIEIKKAVCNDCDFYFDLGSRETILKAAEQHMMKTGHTVTVE